MTDEQLVLALITAYKNRGVDLSSILDDPLFEKLPAASKIQAIQQHATTLHEGVSGRPNSTDIKRVLGNSILDGLGGALSGMGIGLAINAASPVKVPVTRAVGLGAFGGGLLGSFAGGMKAYSDVSNRREVKHSLGQAAKDPSIANAVNVLSTGHMSHRSRSLRDAILDRVSSTVKDNATPYINNQIGIAHTSAIQEKQILDELANLK